MLFPIFVHLSNIFILMFMNSPCNWPVKEWHPLGNLRFLNQCIFQRGVLRSKEVGGCCGRNPRWGWSKWIQKAPVKVRVVPVERHFAVLQVGFYMILVFLLPKVILCRRNLMLSMKEFFCANGWIFEIETNCSAAYHMLLKPFSSQWRYLLCPKDFEGDRCYSVHQAYL